MGVKEGMYGGWEFVFLDFGAERFPSCINTYLVANRSRKEFNLSMFCCGSSLKLILY